MLPRCLSFRIGVVLGSLECHGGTGTHAAGFLNNISWGGEEKKRSCGQKYRLMFIIMYFL